MLLNKRTIPSLTVKDIISIKGRGAVLILNNKKIKTEKLKNWDKYNQKIKVYYKDDVYICEVKSLDIIRRTFDEVVGGVVVEIVLKHND